MIKSGYFNTTNKVVVEENIIKTLLKFSISEDHFVECVYMHVYVSLSDIYIWINICSSTYTFLLESV
jgi:hypothetical protein